MSGTSGFTYLELIAVIVIIGGLMALVAPRFAGTGRTYLRTDARRLATLTRYVYEATATKRLSYRLRFDLDGGSVSLAASAGGGEFVPEADPVLRRLKLRRGVELADIVVPGPGKVTSGEVDVFFAPSGPVDPFVVHLSYGADVKTLDFNPYSGRVRVRDGYL
ncbi:MAG: Tfp pilus assembly protein FimT/FimU [Thermodesulfobacteriota bacterium]